MARIFLMEVLILAFYLVFGFLLLKSFERKKILKKKIKFKIAEYAESRFFFVKNEIFNDDCFFLLKEYSLKTVKEVDKILSKVRFNKPRNLNCYFNLNLLNELKIKKLPIFIVSQSLKRFEKECLKIAKTLEDFEVVIFSYSLVDLGFEAIFLDPQTSKQIKNFLYCLNINFKIEKPLKLNLYPNVLNFYGNYNNSKIISDKYVLNKLENEKFFIEDFNFFTGEKVNFVRVQNKTNEEKKFEFNYFLDLAKNKINYKFFKTTKNIVRIFDAFSSDVKFLNFSFLPFEIKYDCFENFKESNLPCVNLIYKLLLAPNEKKEFCFCFSNYVQPVKLINFEKLCGLSKKFFSKFFNFKIKTHNERLNNLFNQILRQKCFFEFLNNENKEIKCYNLSYKEILNLYDSQKITSLETFISLKYLMIEENDEAFIIKTDFISRNFSIEIYFEGFSKQIDVIRKGGVKPCLNLGGIKYYNNSTIHKKYLRGNDRIVIEC